MPERNESVSNHPVMRPLWLGSRKRQSTVLVPKLVGHRRYPETSFKNRRLDKRASDACLELVRIKSRSSPIMSGWSVCWPPKAQYHLPHLVQHPPLPVHFQENAIVAVEALACRRVWLARDATLLHGRTGAGEVGIEPRRGRSDHAGAE
jgi:hypothetical protein